MTESAKRIYLDVCALCRPFDDQSQMRIRLETEAVQLILSHVRSGDLTLVVSPVHDMEINAIDTAVEREHLLSMLNETGSRVALDLHQARRRAEQLTKEGLGPADAALLSFAEMAEALRNRQIQAAFEVCRFHNINDYIFIGMLIKHLNGYLLCLTARLQSVCPGHIDKLCTPAAELHTALCIFNRRAGIIGDNDVCTGKPVKNNTLADVRVAHKKDFHLSFLPLSSTNTLEAIPNPKAAWVSPCRTSTGPRIHWALIFVISLPALMPQAQ